MTTRTTTTTTHTVTVSQTLTVNGRRVVDEKRTAPADDEIRAAMKRSQEALEQGDLAALFRALGDEAAWVRKGPR